MDNYEFVIEDTYAKMRAVMGQHEGQNIRVAYSGGSDSDTIMWMLRWQGYNVTGTIYDTGLEYQATWKHVDWMREQGFSIEVIKAKRPIPTSQREYGYAFINKRVSDYMSRLQRHNFSIEQHGRLSYEELVPLYPKALTALRWWTNSHDNDQYNIRFNKRLKEFLLEYGLPFKVSGKCCDGAKKMPIKEHAKENNITLMILGIRKSEKGSRSMTYKNCYLPAKTNTYDMYFPMFWWDDDVKKRFDKEHQIKHSDAYEVYGLHRTGCAGCPFGRKFEEELEVIDQFEPKLSKGVDKIFGPSYNWTRKYREFRSKEDGN